MLSREKALQILPLLIVSLSRICSAIEMGSCIRYQTYIITDYRIVPFDFSDDWFSRSHLSPRKQTRIGMRTRRLYGCCEPGTRYQGYPVFECMPICSKPCPPNSSCSAPEKCVCDLDYHLGVGGCILNSQTDDKTTTAEPVTTTEQLPCNGSCETNQECSASEGICVCLEGFERAAGTVSSECLPKMSTTEVTTTSEPETTQLPCKGLCGGANEECSLLENICVCKDGYQRLNNSTSTCEPKCEPKCQNSNCVAPNTCGDCWTNYERVNSTSCKLKCSEQSCVYGKCDAAGVCVCAEGFLNNGTACVWAADAILPEPDDCDCWSKFVWQENKTEISSAHRCMALCDGDDSIEVTSDCINFKHCQCYEGFLVCHAQMYKCFAEAKEQSHGTYSASEIITPIATKMNFTMPIVGFVVVVIIVGASLLLWKKRQSLFNKPGSTYNHMDGGEEQLL